MKFLIASLLTESNTFCPEKNTLEHFQIIRGQEIIKQIRGTKGSFIAGVINTADKLGVELLPTIVAYANPFGPITKEVFDFFLNGILSHLDNHKDIGGIALCLHGGIVAEHIFDPEVELVLEIRRKIGKKTPIVCTLDMHANISSRLIAIANAIFGNNENPHLDSYERGVEATEVLYKIAKGELEPVMAIEKPGLLPPTLYMNPPKSGPLVEIFNEVFEREKDSRIININIAVGFPWADVPHAGMSVIVVADKEKKLAEEIAQEFSEKLWKKRHEFIPKLPSTEEAVEEALSIEGGPVILADVADNPGDGTTQDSTEILHALLKKGVRDAAIAVIRDPEAVKKCIATGVRNEVELNLGGKDPRTSGEPIQLVGKIKTISDGLFVTRGPLYGGAQVDMGRTVVVETHGIEIIITEETCNPVDPEIFRRNGIRPSRKKILVIKTFKMHSEPNYRSFAKKFIEVDALGQATIDLKRLKWKNIPRPLFPIDDD